GARGGGGVGGSGWEGESPPARAGACRPPKGRERAGPPPPQQSRRSLWPRGDYLMGTDRLSAPSECRAQALHCRMVADTAIDEQVRTLWISMAQTWSKLAEAMERLQLHSGLSDADGERPG